jgi:protein-L-isoaspartate(D-aspartate) O-methyltransferase
LPFVDRVQEARQAYARAIAASAGVPLSQHKLIAAFATVPREHFLGPPPWRLFTRSGDVEEPTDPVDLYQDALVSLKPEAHLNNGQPSLHMGCLAALDVKEGETVVHVGAGTGYYTAILATLTGPSGRIVGFEIDADLARRAKDCLAGYPNVEVRHESGTTGALPQCDVVYVNAGATEPLRAWTDALRAGGRLLFPLTPEHGAGYMLLISRTPAGTFAAQFIGGAVFTPCIGGRDEGTSRHLATTFAKRDASAVRSLRFDDPPDDSCWFAGAGWWLSTANAD